MTILFEDLNIGEPSVLREVAKKYKLRTDVTPLPGGLDGQPPGTFVTLVLPKREAALKVLVDRYIKKKKGAT